MYVSFHALRAFIYSIRNVYYR